MAGKNKRKRQGSESSNQSCVSDDIPGQRKKTRISANLSKQEILKINDTEVVTKKPDESSDSDEPLSDMIGKSRSSRGSSKSQGTSPTLISEEKVLRNNKVLTINNTTSNATNLKSTNTSPNVSTQSTSVQISLANHGGKNTSIKSEEKIGTRRSVRMTTSSLATNKANVKTHVLGNASTSIMTQNTGTNNNNTSAKLDQNEPRRKTRSTGTLCRICLI
jgi:hypothetical protein